MLRVYTVTEPAFSYKCHIRALNPFSRVVGFRPTSLVSSAGSAGKAEARVPWTLERLDVRTNQSMARVD